MLVFDDSGLLLDSVWIAEYLDVSCVSVSSVVSFARTPLSSLNCVNEVNSFQPLTGSIKKKSLQLTLCTPLSQFNTTLLLL